MNTKLLLLTTLLTASLTTHTSSSMYSDLIELAHLIVTRHKQEDALEKTTSKIDTIRDNINRVAYSQIPNKDSIACSYSLALTTLISLYKRQRQDLINTTQKIKCLSKTNH